ncbi:hypothetical protein ACWCPQ_33585 [Nocardia sp. NPDC001965]
MDIETEYVMKRDFGQWDRMRSQIPHGENEVERAVMIEHVGEIELQWTRGDHRDEWEALRDLREQWRQDPQRMRAATDSALGQVSWVGIAGNDLASRHLRHMAFARSAFDPIEQAREQWNRMHDNADELRGRLWAAESDDEAREIRNSLNRVIDPANWPAAWHEFEAEIETDTEWWADRDAIANDECHRVLAQREIEQARAEQDAEVEMEESPW